MAKSKKTISFTVDEKRYEEIMVYAKAKGHGGNNPITNFARYAVLTVMHRIDLRNNYPLPHDKAKDLSAIRASRSYRRWRKIILKRDNYRCQKCGEKRFLHVHHILPFSKYPELRLDPKNGITLCVNCHIEEHREMIISRNNLLTSSEHYLNRVEA